MTKRPTRLGDLPNSDDSRSGPFVEWYETWLAEHGKRQKAEAADRARMERNLRWMMRFMVGWTVLVVGATVGVIWLVL